MKKVIGSAIALVSVWVVSCSLVSASTSISATLAASHPQIAVSGENVVLGPNGQAERDFGAVDPVSVHMLAADFVLRNASTSAVSVTGLYPSCKCTSATFAGSGTADFQPLPLDFAPGEVKTLRVTVALDSAVPGKFVKTVTIQYSTGTSSAPSDTAVEMHFEIAKTVDIEPVVVKLGRFDSGSAPSQTVTLSVDKRLLATGEEPIVISSSPDIRVEKTSTPAVADGNFERINYTVAIQKSAPIGPMLGDIIIQVRNGDETSGGALQARAMLVGTVVGPANALPDSLSFGRIAAGTTPTAQVELNGPSAAVDGASATTDAPWIDVKLTKPMSAEQGAGIQRYLLVSVKGDCPSGLHSGTVIVSLGDSNKISIPVNAYISASPATTATRL